MLIVAERINSSRKSISEAIKARDADFICNETRSQAEAGANSIDVMPAALSDRKRSTFAGW